MATADFAIMWKVPMRFTSTAAVERAEVVRDELAGLALLRHGAVAVRDAGAVDEDALDAVLRPRPCERRVDRGLAATFASAEDGADLAPRLTRPFSAFMSRIATGAGPAASAPSPRQGRRRRP